MVRWECSVLITFVEVNFFVLFSIIMFTDDLSRGATCSWCNISDSKITQ